MQFLQVDQHKYSIVVVIVFFNNFSTNSHLKQLTRIHSFVVNKIQSTLNQNHRVFVVVRNNINFQNFLFAFPLQYFINQFWLKFTFISALNKYKVLKKSEQSI